MSLKGKVAVVTGAGRGIGRSVALALASSGARVAALARTKDEVEQTAAMAAAGAILPIAADVSLPQSIRPALNTVSEQLGAIDILVNNAGLYYQKPILETPAEDWQRVFQVNCLGAILCTQEVLPEMLRRREGRIINICSSAGHRAYAGQGAYVASKHALLGFTKVLAEETRGTGVRVHAVSPGGVNTVFVKGYRDVDLSEYMHPDEIAEVVLFLAKMDGMAAIDEVIMRRTGAEPFR